MPRRLDFVTFRVGDRDVDLPWQLAVELRVRLALAVDTQARAIAERIAAVGASRPVLIRHDERAAFERVLKRWADDVDEGLELLRVVGQSALASPE